MESSGGRFIFQQRKEKIDWRKLASVDVGQIARDVDVDAIQENIISVTYCDIEHELGYQRLDPNVIKLFRLAQLTIEYLLHCQEYLQQCLQEKETNIETANLQTQHILSEQETTKADLAKRNESYKNLKKELQKCRKLISDYQLMIRAGASGLHKCPCCSKSFVSEYYLRSHIERRHPEEATKSQPHYPITINHSYHGDTELLNELNDIKSRLKYAEDELHKEKQSNGKTKDEGTAWETVLAEVRNEHDVWKQEEKDRMKEEMEKYKTMIMDELKESRKENEILKKTLNKMEEETGTKKSNLGHLMDEGEENLPADSWVQQKFLEMEARFQQQIAQLKADHKIELQDLRNDRKKSVITERAKREKIEKQMEENQKIFQSRLAEMKQELLQKHKQEKKVENEEVQIDSGRSKFSIIPTASLPPPPKDNGVLKSPSHEATDKESIVPEKDLMPLWISTKSNGHQSYRVFKQPASTKGGWRDLFTFSASLTPVGQFQKAVYVFSCGGSPYWRQYVSTSDSPPAPNYKTDFSFYVSPTKLIGTTKLFIFEAGRGSTVVRSLVSRDEAVPSWKYSGISFFVLSSNVSKANLSRSGTFNSSFGSTDEDDDVTLSSLTVTDAAKQKLAEEIKRSRENLLIDDDGKNLLEHKETDDEGSEAEDEFSIQGGSVIEGVKDAPDGGLPLKNSMFIGEDGESNFGGTSSGSLLGSTIPEQGDFQPFERNPLAKARYNHSEDRLKQEKENILEVLEDNLEKHGVDSSERMMPSAVLLSKMKLHEKETQMIEKKYRGFITLREQLQAAIHDATLLRWASKKKKKVVSHFKKAAHAVTACASPKKEIYDDVTPQKKVRSPEKEHVISRFERQDSRDNDVESDDDDGDYESIDDDVNTNVRQNSNVKRQAESRDVNDDDDEFEVSESSEWDSEDDLRDRNNGAVGSSAYQQQSSNVDEDQEYKPKLRAPQGEKVKKLAADLEASLTMRDKTRKKPAGGVDLHTPNEGEGSSGGQALEKAKRSVSFRDHNDDLGNIDDDVFDDESDFSLTSFEASKNISKQQQGQRSEFDDYDDDDDIDAMLANYQPAYKPSASSTPHSSKQRTPVTALNLDDFDDSI